jgi:hypothetical protein
MLLMAIRYAKLLILRSIRLTGVRGGRLFPRGTHCQDKSGWERNVSRGESVPALTLQPVGSNLPSATETSSTVCPAEASRKRLRSRLRASGNGLDPLDIPAGD